MKKTRVTLRVRDCALIIREDGKFDIEFTTVDDEPVPTSVLALVCCMEMLSDQATYSQMCDEGLRFYKETGGVVHGLQ